MRQLLIFAFIILCSGCSDEKKEYSDLTGKWRFESDTFSGEFQIEKTADGKLVARGGTFTINGTQYSNVYTQELSIRGFLVNPTIYMSDGSNENWIMLAFVTFLGKYETMASQRQLVTDCVTCTGSRLIDKTVEITRQ